MSQLKRLLAWLAVVGLVLGVAAPAAAADVDYVVNVSTDKSVYRADEKPVVTVTIANRGAADASVPADLTLTSGYGLPNLASPVQCVATGGAVCPSVQPTGADWERGYAAQLPALTRSQTLTFTFNLNSWEYGGSREVRAKVTPRDGDTEVVQSTNVSVVKPQVVDVSGDYATEVTQPMVRQGEVAVARASFTNKSGTTPPPSVRR